MSYFPPGYFPSGYFPDNYFSGFGDTDTPETTITINGAIDSFIYVGEPVGLESTITSDGSPVNITGAEISFNYYLPFNYSSIPDGSISGEIVSGPDGTVIGVFPAVLNSAAGALRLQAKAIIDGSVYYAKTSCQQIYNLGEGCGVQYIRDTV